MRYSLIYTKQYKRAIRKIVRQNRSILTEIEKVVDLLLEEKILEKKYKDHALSGTLKGFREVHIRPDILLVYRRDKREFVLVLVHIGSHSNLF